MNVLFFWQKKKKKKKKKMVDGQWIDDSSLVYHMLTLEIFGPGDLKTIIHIFSI